MARNLTVRESEEWAEVVITYLEANGYPFNRNSQSLPAYLASCLTDLSGSSSTIYSDSLPDIIIKLAAQFSGLSLNNGNCDFTDALAILNRSILDGVDIGGGGGGAYVAKAVEFAASSGLVCGSSSLADTEVLSGRLLINWSADAYNDDDAILNITRTDMGGAANFLMDQFLGNSDPSTVGIQMTGTDSGNTFYVGSETGSVVNDVWYEYFFSMDIGHEAGSRLATSYIGDTDIKQIVIDTGSSFVLPLNGYKIRLPDGFFPGPVRLADCWVTTTHYVDWSDPANRAKFRSGGKPVDLGSDGSTPFGYQPEIFFSGDHTGFPTNKGSAGDVFTLTGTLTDATTSPSD